MIKSRQYSDGVLAAAVKVTTTPMINQIDLINQCEKGAWVLFVSFFSPSSDWAMGCATLRYFPLWLRGTVRLTCSAALLGLIHCAIVFCEPDLKSEGIPSVHCMIS